MEKALQTEVEALIAGAIKPVTEQMGSLAEAVKPVGALVTQVADLGKNVKTVADTLQALPPAAAAGGAGDGKKKTGEADAPKYLTAEDMVKVLDQRDAARASSAARESFIAEKMKDLPAAYRTQLGADSTKWAAEEQSIRTAFQADFKAAGGKVEDLSGQNKGGAAPAVKPDLSKMTPSQMVRLGLKNMRTQNPVAPVEQVKTAVVAADGAAGGAASGGAGGGAAK